MIYKYVLNTLKLEFVNIVNDVIDDLVAAIVLINQ